MKNIRSFALVAGLALAAASYFYIANSAADRPPGALSERAQVAPDAEPAHGRDAAATIGLALGFVFCLGSIRTLRDANLSVTKALPAAAASASTDAIQLGALIGGGAGVVLETIELELVVPDLPSLADAKTATFSFEDSADGSSFAAIAGLSTIVLTGAGGIGATGFTRQVRVPSTTRAYVRSTCAVQSAGGDNTAKSMTLSVLG